MKRFSLPFHPSWLLLLAASSWATAATMSLTLVRGTIPLQANQERYHDLAVRLLDRGHMDLPFDQSILYPGFVAAIYVSTGRDPQHVRQVQSLLTGLLVFLVGLLAMRAWGSRPAALSAVFMAVPPILPVVGSQLVPTVPAMVLLLGAMLSVQRALQGSRPSLGLSLGAGLLAGLAAGFQSFVFAAGLLTGLLTAWSRPGRKVGLTFLAGLAILPLAVGSWTKEQTGRFVALTENAGLNLFLGWNPSADGTDPFFDPMQRALKRRLERQTGKAGLQRALARQALHFAVHCPRRSLQLTGRKLALLLDRTEPGNNERPATTAAMSPLTRFMPGTWLIMMLAAAGLIWRKPPSTLSAAISGLILAAAGIAVIFFSCARFRLLALPGFAILASSLWDLPTNVQARRKRAALAVLAALVTGLSALGAERLLGATTPAGLLVNEGVLALQAGRKERAKRLFEQAVQRRPEDLLGRLYLARMARSNGRPCDALFQASMAVLADPTSSAARRVFTRLGREAGFSAQHLAIFGQQAVKQFQDRAASFNKACRSSFPDQSPARHLAETCLRKHRFFHSNIRLPKGTYTTFRQGGRRP